MSQEHRFCAEVYARLFPLIDRTQRVVINPDGQAKLPSCPDGDIPPDLCFTLCGLRNEVRIEAKILRDKRDINLEASQRTWCIRDVAPVAPHLWVVADRNLGECWLFEHVDIAQRVRGKTGLSAPLNLWPGQEPPTGCSLDELALKIIAWTSNHLSRTQDTT